jgi:hypothetical protein
MKKIKIHRERIHRKAYERYLDVTFFYEDNQLWEGSIPIEYRRTGIDLSNASEIDQYLGTVYDYCHPDQQKKWLKDQEKFWENKQKQETWKLFQILITFQWTCISCHYNNPNWARRNQDLKELGYTIATYTYRFCTQCNQSKRTFLMLVPLPRGGISGYETWSANLRKRIVMLLNSYDAYEGKTVKKESLLPDHKFPEIRWTSETKRDSLENITDEVIKQDFQLLTNQRNLQKREVCRHCYQTDLRGFPFGIKYYYQGNEKWPENIVKQGKEAEKGCIGCGWYDLESWRNSLNQDITRFHGLD